MAAPRLLVDGLWRCLCPYVDPTIILRPLETQLALVTPFSTPFFRRPRISRYHGHRQVRSAYTAPDPAVMAKRRGLPTTPGPSGSPTTPTTSADAPGQEMDSGGYTSALHTLLAADYPYQCIKRTSVPVINEAIEHLKNVPGSLDKMAVFVSHLLRYRNQKPSARMYAALLAANADTTGSADAVLELLEGMVENGVLPDHNVCHTVLRTLVNHPDYLIREDIMHMIKTNWIDLSTSGHMSIVLGILRDGQPEMAMETLVQYFDEGVRIPSYVYAIFAYRFAELGYFDETLQIMHHRMRNLREPWSKPSRAQWYFVLELASAGMHYRAVKYIWKRRVLVDRNAQPHRRDSPEFFTPPDGVVENVLATAARHGDVPLAMEAMQVLTDRRTRLQLHHYEALIEAYVAAGQLENAVTALFIMDNAKIMPFRGTTRPIFRAIIEDPEILPTAIGWLVPKMVERNSGRRSVYKPSPAAFNVALEAVVHIRGLQGTHGALAMLRSAVRQQTIPLDAESFNVILRSFDDLSTVKKVETLMGEARVSINAETLDLFLSIYSDHGSYSSAQRWASIIPSMKARHNRWIVSQETALKFILRALNQRDELAWRVVMRCKHMGINLHPALISRARLYQQRQESRESAATAEFVAAGA